MFAPIVLLAIFLPNAAVTPAPSASPAPLKEIVHVRSSAICSELAVHTNGAIGSATRNDLSIASAITSLKASNLTDNDLTLHQGMDRLRNYADAITKEWKDGEREAGQLRDLAKKVTDPTEKQAVTASADALAGALHRQRLIARDLDGFLAYVDAREMATPSESEANANQSLFGASDVHQANTRPNGQDVNSRHSQPTTNIGTVGLANDPDHIPTIAEQALAAARDFQDRLPALIKDEINAADHIGDASENC